MNTDMLTELERLLPPLVDGIMAKSQGAGEYTIKSDNSLLTMTDLRLQQALSDLLQQRWPDVSFLGEEMDAGEQQQIWESSKAGLWCLDPLDGTSNFAMGIPFYAVSLALIQNQQVVLGLVYDPVRRECFSAAKGQGAWLNGAALQKPPAPEKLADAMAIVDFKRLPAELARRLASEQPFRSQRSFGSVALDWCWLATGRGQVYLHGRQNIWDYGAGQLIFNEAGGKDCTLQGAAVNAVSLQPRSAVAALDAGLYAQWRAWLGVKE